MGGQSSSSSESGPWDGQVPYIKDIYGQAQGLYNKGAPAYYPNQTYTDFNPVQEGAMESTLDRSGGSSTERGFQGMLEGELSSPRVNLAGSAGSADLAQSGLGQGMGAIQGQTGGMGLDASRSLADQGTQGMQSILSDMSQYGGSLPSESLDVQAKSKLSSLASGNNPYLDDMARSATDSVKEQFSESVMPSINATFGMGGRTGSRAHTDTVAKAGEGLADTISNMTSDIYGSNYQSDMDRRLRSAESLGGLEVDEFGQNSNRRSIDQNYDVNRRDLAQDAVKSNYGYQLDSNDAMNSWYNQGADRSLEAGGMLTDTAMGGIDDITQMYGTQGNTMLGAGGLVGDLSDMQWSNIDRMRGVGDDVQGLSDSMLEDDINRFNYYQQAPWEMLSRYNSAINPGGVNVSTGDSGGWSLQF